MLVEVHTTIEKDASGDASGNRVVAERGAPLQGIVLQYGKCSTSLGTASPVPSTLQAEPELLETARGLTADQSLADRFVNCRRLRDARQASVGVNRGGSSR